MLREVVCQSQQIRWRWRNSIIREEQREQVSMFFQMILFGTVLLFFIALIGLSFLSRAVIWAHLNMMGKDTRKTWVDECWRKNMQKMFRGDKMVRERNIRDISVLERKERAKCKSLCLFTSLFTLSFGNLSSQLISKCSLLIMNTCEELVKEQLRLCWCCSWKKE